MPNVRCKSPMKKRMRITSLKLKKRPGSTGPLLKTFSQNFLQPFCDHNRINRSSLYCLRSTGIAKKITQNSVFLEHLFLLLFLINQPGKDRSGGNDIHNRRLTAMQRLL